MVPQPLSEALVVLWLLPPASSRARSALLRLHQCRVWLRHQSTFVWRCPCYTASQAYFRASCRPDANQGCSYLLSPLCLLPGCRSGARVSAHPQRSLISFHDSQEQSKLMILSYFHLKYLLHKYVYSLPSAPAHLTITMKCEAFNR